MLLFLLHKHQVSRHSILLNISFIISNYLVIPWYCEKECMILVYLNLNINFLKSQTKNNCSKLK
jgi:hypothetical protein